MQLPRPFLVHTIFRNCKSCTWFMRCDKQRLPLTTNKISGSPENNLLGSSKLVHHLSNYGSHFGICLMLSKICRVLHYCKEIKQEKEKKSDTSEFFPELKLTCHYDKLNGTLPRNILQRNKEKIKKQYNNIIVHC